MSQQHIRVLPAKISLGSFFFFFLCAFCFLKPIPFFCVCVIVLEAGGRYNLQEARHGLFFFFSKKDDRLNRFSAEGVENMRTVRPFLSLFLPFLSLFYLSISEARVDTLEDGSAFYCDCQRVFCPSSY